VGNFDEESNNSVLPVGGELPIQITESTRVRRLPVGRQATKRNSITKA